MSTTLYCPLCGGMTGRPGIVDCMGESVQVPIDVARQAAIGFRVQRSLRMLQDMPRDSQFADDMRELRGLVFD